MTMLRPEPGRPRPTRTRIAATIVAVTALAIGCEKVPLMAPAGTGVTLQANPSFVAANGGRALVTAVLTEPTATFVADGTVVYFFSDLGGIDASAKTVDGIARAFFVADSRSGRACVTAYSGGTAPSAACAAPGDGDGGGTGVATGTGSASVAIDVGSALPARVVVTANPARVLSPGRATIVANVFDEVGNPVQNVPVIFLITDSSFALEETLDNGGFPVYTDSNGQAFDTLRTRAAVGSLTKTVEVTVSVPGVDDATVTVRVN